MCGPQDVATWVCIAVRLTDIDVDTVEVDEAGGRVHGAFLLPESWCERCGGGEACLRMRRSLPLSVHCARMYAQQRAGDGFNAWEAYKFCRHPAAFLAGC